MPEQKQVTVVATTTVRHDGETYQAGDELTVDENRATQMLEAGSARKPEDEPTAAERAALEEAKLAEERKQAEQQRRTEENKLASDLETQQRQAREQELQDAAKPPTGADAGITTKATTSPVTEPTTPFAPASMDAGADDIIPPNKRKRP